MDKSHTATILVSERSRGDSPLMFLLSFAFLWFALMGERYED